MLQDWQGEQSLKRNGWRCGSQMCVALSDFWILPKDYILWFHLKWHIVLIVPALEWREAVPWPQPLRFVCFVCAPAPINILALSGQRVRVPHRGSQKCTPSPVPSTFRAQQLFLPACVNGSSYFSFGRRAEAWGGGEELFYPFRDCTIEYQFANCITLPVSQIITVSLLWTRKTEGFTSCLSIPAQVRISWRAFEAHQHLRPSTRNIIVWSEEWTLGWRTCGWLQALPGIQASGHCHTGVVLLCSWTYTHCSVLERLEEPDLALPLCVLGFRV